MSSVDLSSLAHGLPKTQLPEHPGVHPDASVPRAPRRNANLTDEERVLALKNALRYFPTHFHATLAPEFAQELKDEGHIYMHRFRPTQYAMKAYAIDLYPAKCRAAAAIQLMIMNNLDHRVAQFPNHLITYGGNGSVFSNWAQYHLMMEYLSVMTDEQTLVMYSGHPMGLFPSKPDAPRVIVTNGMMIPNYSTRDMYDKCYALGTTQYGQMTAGSYCYIGPQGIVHGTTITVLNAGRKYLGKEDLSGVVYVSSGLGGMSGAQPKAGVISGAISVTAEVDGAAVKKRHEQGWVDEVVSDLDACVARIRTAKHEKKAVSIAFHGNIVTLWERLADEIEKTGELLVELGSDQTSLHNPYNGGYYPADLTFEASQAMMVEDPTKFKEHVQASLRRHVTAVNRLTTKGMKFWDYGNSFLLEAKRAGAPVCGDEKTPATMFCYPSYVQDIMGDIFSLGFGPFRWICSSGTPEDLRKTDQIAARVLRELLDAKPHDRVAAQLRDNLKWIEAAEENELVVGSQARILYADREARQKIALAFNDAIAAGEVHAPVILSRDHHDVSGTDSPYRETSNVYDGSMFCADMAIHNVIGDAARGATWVSIHNGGGVGWGEVMNGGFGMVLDGSQAARDKAASMLYWDVNNGVARRAWARNDNARLAIERDMELNPLLRVTLPADAEDASVRDVCRQYFHSSWLPTDFSNASTKSARSRGPVNLRVPFHAVYQSPPPIRKRLLLTRYSMTAAPRDRIVLLFCHGGSCNKEIWTPILRRIERSPLLQRVATEFVTIDWRYHGRKSSDADAATVYYEHGDETAPRVEHPGKHWPEWAPPDLLETTKALRRDDNALNRTTQIVGIGHSMGAATLLHVEVHYPGTFAGLVLFEPPFAVDERPESLGMAATVMVISTLGREEEWNTWTEAVDHFRENKLFRRWHPESLMAFLQHGIKKTADGKRYRLAMPLIQEASLYCHDLMCFTKQEIARVACPVVFEFGDHTRLFNLPLVMDVAATLPTIFTIAAPLEGLSHLTIAEDPETCTAHILVDLEKLPVFQAALAAVDSTKSRL